MTDPVRLSPGDWQARLDEVGDHSFFATPAWGAILERAGLGYRAYALELSAAGARALLPVAERRVGPFQIGESMPFGTYGGLLPVQLEPGCDLGRAGAEMQAQLRRVFRRGTLYGTAGPHPCLDFGTMVETFQTSVIDLAPGPEALWANLEKDARNQVRQAERAGVAVAVENSEAAFREYYAMLEETARGWEGSSGPRPWPLFASIAEEAAKGPGVKLWLARVEGRLAAGALCFYGRGEVFHWSGAMDREQARARANHGIQWAVIKDAAESGAATYNMGASAGLPNVEAFKKQFGAVLTPYSFCLLRGGLYNSARRVASLFRRRPAAPAAR